ncbi:MAG: ribosome-associated translation inhibitor RaiA [Nitriliruptoraceae bacterium]
MTVRVQVTTKNCDVDPRVQQEAIEKLSKVRRLFDRFIDMEVIFTQDHNPRIHDAVHCEVVLHARRHVLTASAAGPDAMTAVDRVEPKIVRRVRKLKTRLVKRPRQLAAAEARGV